MEQLNFGIHILKIERIVYFIYFFKFIFILVENGKFIEKFIFSQNSKFIEIPTSICWNLNSIENIISGYYNLPSLVSFDMNTVNIIIIIEINEFKKYPEKNIFHVKVSKR